MPRPLIIASVGAVALTLVFAMLGGGSLGAVEIVAILVGWFVVLLAVQGLVQVVRRQFS
jgi:hypothetical protein